MGPLPGISTAGLEEGKEEEEAAFRGFLTCSDRRGCLWYMSSHAAQKDCM